MTRPDPYPVQPVAGPLDAAVTVPGSKSITNRALVCAALADGRSTLRGALFADDTAAMVDALRAVRIPVDADAAEARMVVDGCGGRVPSAERALDVRQSGTTSRFVLAVLAAGTGSYEVTAHPQMRARPMETTFEALRELGVRVEPRGRPGHLPARVDVDGTRSASLTVPGDTSSQFLSGLLLVGPCLPDGLDVTVAGDLVSRPYVDLTVSVMEAFGAQVEVDGARYRVAPTGYRATDHQVEPDASAASYPLAAAALCGGSVTVLGLRPDAWQGDAAFADVLGEMGASVHRSERGTTVTGPSGPLAGGRFDLRHLSDTAQTLAVVAPFAADEVRIGGIGFIRHKEIDRVAAVATELTRAGVDVAADDDGWTIRPGRPHAAVIETYEDHRMAMSFALAGLVVEGIEIVDPACVAKTFPGYWSLLESLGGREADR